MKKLLVFILIMLIASTALGAGITSDPQEGVESHLFECGSYSVVTPALPDGAFFYDFADWPGGPGWFDCTVKAQNTYRVIDVATSVETSATMISGPAQIRIKIPNNNANAGYKISQ